MERRNWMQKLADEADLPAEPVDMFTTVFIGSQTTKVIGGRMVTPRGYEKREAFQR